MDFKEIDVTYTCQETQRPGQPSIDNCAHDTEKLLLNTQVSEDFE